MKNFSLLSALEKINAKVFFLFLFLFQVLFIFQGIDLSDEGFYATFYQQVFTQPETAQYNFMFWFSGIIGGGFNYLFPGLGLWGIRLAGVLVTTGTIIITYNLLKKYMNQGHLKAGLLLVLLFVNNNLKEFHYNNLSAFLNMLIIYFLFLGLKENKMSKIFLSGLFLSVSTFSRIPNILCAGLALAIFYYGYHHKNNLKKQVSQLLVFGAGFVFMTALLLGFMQMIGHLEIFINSLKLLSKMGSGDEKSFYGPMALIKNFFFIYSVSFKDTAYILLLIAIAAITVNFFKRYPSYKQWIIDLLKYAILLLLCVLFITGKLDREMILYFFTGLTLIATLLILITKSDQDMKLLTLMGCFILVTYPFSSSAGLYSAGIYSFWLSLPIAIDYLFNLVSVRGQFQLFHKKDTETAGFIITEPAFSQIKKYVFLICTFGCLVYTYRYPFFDRHDRLKMTYSINSKYLKGIFTTKERAAAMNELLQQSAKYLNENDFLLAYQCIPMLNYITHTRPYMRNSYPWLYDAETFKTELYKGLDETKTLPVIIKQKIKTIGDGGNWPDNVAVFDHEWETRNKQRDLYLEDFLNSNQYHEVWTNQVFSILVPAERATGKRD